MTKIIDLKNFSEEKNYKMIIASDAEPRVSIFKRNGHAFQVPAGGVAVALESIAASTNAYYVARARHEEEMKVLNSRGEMTVDSARGEYTLKRLFFDKKTVDGYYYGFSNQTLWPLCHVAFEEPKWSSEWFRNYVKVNEEYAKAIKSALDPKRKNFVWVNDYQLSLVPKFLNKQKNTTVAMFWHIPWPTWEIFRILPYKNEILDSMLYCDFLAFHRGYQARNFLDTVEREFQLRIDRETQRVFYMKNTTQVQNLPMGIDTDVIESLVKKAPEKKGLKAIINDLLIGGEKEEHHSFEWYFKKYKTILAVSRLDYTKGLKYKMYAIDRFFEKYKKYQGKAVYIGIIAPSREPIPSYQKVKKETIALAEKINKKYAKGDWKPVHLVYETFQREEVINFYTKADACVVTPLDDGMNLVSKEFVIAAAQSKDPGMLVLSQFAGSAIDLTSALIVNPYDIDGVADATKEALEMPKEERVRRMQQMAAQLEDRNVYDWGIEFIRQAMAAKTE